MAKINSGQLLTQKEYQRGYQWNISIDKVPSGVPSLVGKLDYKCLSANTPEKTQDGIKFKIKGLQGEAVGFSEFNGVITLVFLEDIDATILGGFEAWMNYAFNHKDGTHGDRADLYSIFTLSMLDGDGNVTQEYKLRGCRPSSVTGVNLDGEASELVKPSITLAYIDYDHKVI